MDNCTTSIKSTEELNRFIQVAKDVMSAGGFELKSGSLLTIFQKNEITHVLGILFNKVRDAISINPSILSDLSTEKITKRSILSMAHKVFDLIGFTCPVTLILKLILQKLHKQKIDWDTPVHKEKEFVQWYAQLSYSNKIEIPRIFETGTFSLHTFYDASKSTYAAVIFLRVERKDDVVLKFIAAKTRLAPQKATIPRLELLAASIGARRAREIITALEYENTPMFF